MSGFRALDIYSRTKHHGQNVIVPSTKESRWLKWDAAVRASMLRCYNESLQESFITHSPIGGVVKPSKF